MHHENTFFWCVRLNIFQVLHIKDNLRNGTGAFFEISALWRKTKCWRGTQENKNSSFTDLVAQRADLSPLPPWEHSHSTLPSRTSGQMCPSRRPGPTGSRVSHKLLKEEHLLLGYLFFMCIHLTY